MAYLHTHPPMTLGRVHARAGWLLPVVAAVFVLLALGAAIDHPVVDLSLIHI